MSPRFNAAFSLSPLYRNAVRHAREHSRVSLAVATAAAAAGIGVAGASAAGSASAFSNLPVEDHAGHVSAAGESAAAAFQTVIGLTSHEKSGGLRLESRDVRAAGNRGSGVRVTAISSKTAADARRAADPEGATKQAAPSKPAQPHAAPAHHAQAPAAPAQPFLIYDSVTPSAIPANGQAATYVNGAYAAPAATMAGRRHVLWIDTNGSDPAASALDVEPGDATPAGATFWVKAKLSADPSGVAIVYTMISDWPAVKENVATLPQWMQSRVRYWIADPTGVPHMVPGSNATQWYWGNSYDISTAEPGFES